MLISRQTIKWKLYVYYFLLFGVFLLSIVIYQSKREKHFKIAELEMTLNEITDLTDRYIDHYKIIENKTFSRLDSIKSILPSEKSRITIIDTNGIVLYDNTISNYSHLENHSTRPEFQLAKTSGSGISIRYSTSTNEEYVYYAKSYGKIVIRAAMVYNSKLKAFLEADRVFIAFFVLLFLVFGLSLRYIANHIGDSIAKLKDFAVKIRRNEAIENIDETGFSNDELGFISKEIIQIYKKLKRTKGELLIEKEKLISHLNVLKEGIAFFSRDRKIILNNSHFILYINIITDETETQAEKIFDSDVFGEVNQFIEKIFSDNGNIVPNELPRLEYSIQKNRYHFNIQCIIFPDYSFEILITDKTQLMKRSIMKQQITSNISHELKTPIASVKGYLETLLNNPDLDRTKLHYFIKKAFHQSERLTQLVNDIALLNKIEEYSDLYVREKVVLLKVIEEAVEGLSDKIREKGINVDCLIDKGLIVNANSSLVFSVLRNLIENSVNYGGNGITIYISKYHDDNEFYYFSFADNGPGVDEEHLSRLFERFYRVDSGRSRKAGGTGLGLAIVKNAILSIKGDISVRNRKGGGLEFLFSLPK
ncbi:MAG: ATP-binding protein [Mariniphaga sp.]